jgi:hypothetical protein
LQDIWLTFTAHTAKFFFFTPVCKEFITLNTKGFTEESMFKSLLEVDGKALGTNDERRVAGRLKLEGSKNHGSDLMMQCL